MSDDATLDEFADSEKTGTNQEVPPPTELTGVPDDWANVRLAKVAKSDDGAFVDGPFGSNLKADEMHAEGYARVIQLQNIRESEFVDTNHRYISEEKFEELSRHGAEAGDLAIAKMSEPVARACLLPDIEDQYLVVADCIKLSVDESAHNNQFVMLALNSRPVWKQAFARSRGSTRKRINLTQLKEVQIPSPPLSEQRKIATVLHTVDQAIQKTEEIIEQTRRTKTGIQQELFTDGYYDHKPFVETRIGKLPDSWKLEKIKNHTELVSGAHVKSDLVSDDSSLTPYLTGPDDFDEFGFTVTKYTDDPSKFCEAGDTLITVKGSGCGKSTFANQRACISRQLKALRPKDTVEELYLFYFVETKQKLLETLAEGSAIPGLSNSHLISLDIPIPSREEQNKIAEILKRYDEQIAHEKNYKSQLQRLKQGLMQDLLSGEVRTTDAEIDIPEEVTKYG